MTKVIAVAALAVWVLSTSAQAAGYHVIDRLAGPDGGWDYANYDARNDRVLVARGAAVNAFDLKTRSVNPNFAPAAWGHAAMPIKGGTEVLVTNGAKAIATFVDAETGAPIASVPTGTGPDDAIVDPKSGLLLVMNHAGGTITLIDLNTHTSVGTIAVGGTLEAAATDGKGKVFVNVEDKNQIAVVDVAKREVINRYELAGCEGPTGIAYDSADRLLISSCDGVAEVVAADTGKVIDQIKIGDGADGVAYDPVRHLAFVPAGKSGTLSVIAITKGRAKLVETVATQRGARTLAMDIKGGRIFLPTAKYATAIGTARPTVIPGTFELLIVGK